MVSKCEQIEWKGERLYGTLYVIEDEAREDDGESTLLIVTRDPRLAGACAEHVRQDWLSGETVSFEWSFQAGFSFIVHFGAAVYEKVAPGTFEHALYLGGIFPRFEAAALQILRRQTESVIFGVRAGQPSLTPSQEETANV